MSEKETTSETKTQVAMRHKREWARFRVQFIEGERLDEDAAKVAKVFADVLKVYQEGERKAFAFNDEEPDNSMTVGWAE